MPDSLTKNKDFDREKLVFFYAPEAEVVQHLQLQTILAKTLQNEGYKVAFARCFKLFARCPAKAMIQAPFREDLNFIPSGADDTPVCHSCIRNSNRVLSSYDIPYINLWDYAQVEFYEKAASAIATAPIDLLEFIYDGYPFGKASMMDVVWATKISNFSTIAKDHRLKWLNFIHSAIISYEILNSMIKTLNIGRIVHFNEYSLVQTTNFVAEKNDIESVIVTATAHLGGDMGRTIILPECYRKVANDMLENIHDWVSLALPQNLVIDGANDIIARQRTRTQFVYSPAKTFSQSNFKEIIKANLDKKLIVVYTSSLDEFNTSNLSMEVAGDKRSYHQPFEAIEGSYQIGWITDLISHLKDRQDLEVFVRFHPREAESQGNHNKSDHLKLLRKHFSNVPENFRIIWPEDKISSYDLGEVADLVLTMYSGMGSELSRLGVPVLASYKGISITDTEFIEWADNKIDYFTKLEQLLSESDNAKLDRIIKAFRGYATYSLSFALNLSDVIKPDTDLLQIQKYIQPKEHKEIVKAIIEPISSLEINFQKLKSLQSEELNTIEKLEVLKQLRRLIHFVLTGVDLKDDCFLVRVDGFKQYGNIEINKELRDSDLRPKIIYVYNNYVKYIDNLTVIKRYSPLTARLSQICSNIRIRENEIREFTSLGHNLQHVFL